MKKEGIVNIKIAIFLHHLAVLSLHVLSTKQRIEKKQSVSNRKVNATTKNCCCKNAE